MAAWCLKQAAANKTNLCHVEWFSDTAYTAYSQLLGAFQMASSYGNSSLKVTLKFSGLSNTSITKLRYLLPGVQCYNALDISLLMECKIFSNYLNSTLCITGRQQLEAFLAQLKNPVKQCKQLSYTLAYWHQPGISSYQTGCWCEAQPNAAALILIHLTSSLAFSVCNWKYRILLKTTA
jgi:hypothetical protein